MAGDETIILRPIGLTVDQVKALREANAVVCRLACKASLLSVKRPGKPDLDIRVETVINDFGKLRGCEHVKLTGYARIDTSPCSVGWSVLRTLRAKDRLGLLWLRDNTNYYIRAAGLTLDEVRLTVDRGAGRKTQLLQFPLKFIVSKPDENRMIRFKNGENADFGS